MTSGLTQGPRTARSIGDDKRRIAAEDQGSAHQRHGAFEATLLAARQWIPLAIGLLIVITVGVLATRSIDQNTKAEQQLKQSLAVIGGADAVMLAVVEANAAHRGYGLTGEAGFLERYRLARRELTANIATLRPLLVGGAIDPSLLEQFETSLAVRIAGFEQVDAALAGEEPPVNAASWVASRLETDVLRDVLTTIKNDEAIALQNLQRTSRRSAERVRLLTIGGLASASLLALISIVLFARRSAALVKANVEVKELADSLEDRVAERTAALAEANEEIQRFAYIVSHDLRSPLVNVMGFTSELEDSQQMAADYLDALGAEGAVAVPEDVAHAIRADMPEAIRFIRAATSRMDRLIKAILQISREGRRSLSGEMVDLNALFDVLGASLVAQFEAAGATLRIDPLPTIRSDRLALEQIFGNLLDNAVKYLRPGVAGAIIVSGEVRQRQVMICVRDNGRGIAANDRDRVFELFRRAGPQDQPGDGIGLTHVQALLRRLGGRIEVDSVLNEGSRFVVTLPLKMAD
jgi:signal transduction histidine kinase